MKAGDTWEEERFNTLFDSESLTRLRLDNLESLIVGRLAHDERTTRGWGMDEHDDLVDAQSIDATPLDTGSPDAWLQFSAQQKALMDQAQTGWKTAAMLAFAGAISGVSVWYARTGAPEISAPIGIAVFSIVACGLLAFAFGPPLLEGLGSRATALTMIGRLFYPFAVPVLWADVALRKFIAEACGLRMHRWLPRYALLFLHVGLAAAALWVVPRFWPEGAWLGYLGLGWAILALVAIVRQWIWIERQYERQATGHNPAAILKLPDLRDEALFAVLLFFLSIPVILWRLDASFGLFATSGGAPAGWLDWIALFGAELTKAVPFVDWAEVYGAGAVTALSPVAPNGFYVVFATRVIVDLVLLGALVHAVERVGQIARQWREFLAGDRNLVDPSLEHRILRQLKAFAARAGGSWLQPVAPFDLGPFKGYNANRLLALSRDDDLDSAAIVAHAAFAQSPRDAFLPIARDVLEDERRCRTADMRLLLLLVDLLGRVNDPASRDLLERVLTSFNGKTADSTARMRSRSALALTMQWRVATPAARAPGLEGEVVQRLRNGLERNRERAGQIRTAIGDQLSVVGGAGLSAIAEHLRHEASSVVLTNLAVDMKSMIRRASRDQLRLASRHARERVAALLSKPNQNRADDQAQRALSLVADEMDAAARAAAESVPEPAE